MTVALVAPAPGLASASEPTEPGLPMLDAEKRDVYPVDLENQSIRLGAGFGGSACAPGSARARELCR